MTIDKTLLPLNSISYSPYKAVDTSQKAGNVFDDFYKAAVEALNQTNSYQNTSDRIQLDFVTGKTDDFLSVILAQDKAYSSLNFTVQVTNKIIEAYREIMRIQI